MRYTGCGKNDEQERLGLDIIPQRKHNLNEEIVTKICGKNEP